MSTKVNKLTDKLPYYVKLGLSAVMANNIGFVGIEVSGVALLVAIIALAADKWETINEIDLFFEIKIGLWKLCVKDAGIEICLNIADVDTVTDDQKNSVSACKAMIFLAILATTGAIACAVLVMFVMTDKQVLLFAAGGLNFASGLFLMIAMAVYADKVKFNHSYLDYGFALDIIAWLAAWAACGLFMAAKFLNKDLQ